MEAEAELDVRDVGYEESLLRDPYSVKQWLNYLEYKHDAPPQQRILLYERALHHIPGSYKLWYKYLLERMERTRHMPISDGEYEAVNNVFERALVYMHKMPRIWKEYTDFLIRQRHITRSRRTFDKALMSLAVTQHLKWIWPHYLTFARDCGVPETAIRIYRRYLKLEPLEMENYIKFLKKVGRYEEAAQQLAKIVNDDSFQSQRGKSKHDLWTELLQMITKNPTKVGTLDVDAVIRSGIRRFPSEVGRLWVSLADYYIRMGYFEKARDVYEEGINTVSTVRDFTQIFDAYSKFEETMLQAKMKEVQEKENEAAGEEEDGQQQAKHGGELEEIAGDDIDIDMRFIRLEDLANRRPFLLSSVLLRQNPHNVEEWLKRVELYAGDIPKQLLTFTEAVTTVDPHKATGKIQDLWVAFARFYEKHKDLENARTVFDKATQVNYKTVDQLIYIWCEYVEMELRHKKYKRALQVIKRATVIPKGIYSGADVLKNERLSCQQKIHKSTKLWSLYADLEENFGTLETTKAVYEQMIFLKIVTPNIIINYANLMEEHKYFEDSFRVYEKGIDIFEYPHVLPIWMCYLKRFIHRYGGKKIERTRDLFEQALEKIPAKDSKRINLLYAKFEEDYGLAKRAMDIYDRAVTVAPPSDRYEMFLIYIARCAARFGITKTRDIYEKAIKNLPDAFLKSMCLKYAALEKKLGEVDRARAIYNYGAQFADPRAESTYWKSWSDFEVAHGNQETFKDMLRVKRSVTAQFASMNIVASSANIQDLTPSGGSLFAPRAKPSKAAGAGKSLLQATVSVAGTKRKRGEEEEVAEAGEQVVVAAAAVPAEANPEEINIDEEEEEEEVEGAGAQGVGEMGEEAEALSEAHIKTKQVPLAVFGLGGANEERSMGAMERLKRQRQ